MMEEIMTSVRLGDEQEKKIKKTGINKSEFIRRAVDHYLMYLENPYNNILLNELEDWIKYKRITTVTHMNTTVTHNSTTVPHMNTNVPIYNTKNTSVTQKQETKPHNELNETIETKLHEELPMLQRQLNNPENVDTIPDVTLKILSKKYALSKSTIGAWISENIDWIKTGNFDESNQE